LLGYLASCTGFHPYFIWNYYIHLMKLLRTFIPVFLLFFTGCTVTKFVSVPVDYNAKYAFRTDTNTIVIINQFDFSKLNLKSKQKLNVIKGAAFAAVKYAENTLPQLPHVKTLNLIDSANFIVNPDSVKLLALKYHADYVLVLKDFSAGLEFGGADYSVDYYNTNVSVTFLLYESNGVYFKKLTGTANDPSARVPNASLLVSVLFAPTVKGRRNELNESARHAAQVALQDYFPYTLTFSRPLYKDDYLQAANEQILAGKPDKAEALLKPLSQSSDAQTSAKAMYTLSVVYEMEGDLDGARYMAQESVNKFYNYYAVNISADLKNE
jgi:hypothetical protein